MLWKPYQPRPPPLIYFHSRTREDHEASRRKFSTSQDEAPQGSFQPEQVPIRPDPVCWDTLDRQSYDQLRQVPTALPRRISVALCGPRTVSVKNLKNESTNRAICTLPPRGEPLLFNDGDRDAGLTAEVVEDHVNTHLVEPGMAMDFETVGLLLEVVRIHRT